MTIKTDREIWLATNKYFTAFITLNKEHFQGSLTENVTCEHTRMKAGIPTHPQKLNGKDEVVAAYSKHFFEITSDIAPIHSSYDIHGLKAVISCAVNEDKLKGEETKRYHLVSTITLDFVKEGDVYKVCKIWESTAKQLIEG